MIKMRARSPLESGEAQRRLDGPPRDEELSYG